jgi:hypothetical protein
LRQHTPTQLFTIYSIYSDKNGERECARLKALSPITTGDDFLYYRLASTEVASTIVRRNIGKTLKAPAIPIDPAALDTDHKFTHDYSD